jgi:uncharacterized protein
MIFEWDENKNKANLQKHGVSFEEVTAVLSCDKLIMEDSRHAYGEVRFRTIIGANNVIYTVIITMRQLTVCRIISARRANKREMKEYEQWMMKI